MESKRYTVVGDIGGTNFRLRLSALGSDHKYHCVKEIHFDSKKYVSFCAFIDKLCEVAGVSYHYFSNLSRCKQAA
jgi:glucokinase